MIKFKNICPNLRNLFVTGCLHYQHKNICKGVSSWEGEGTLGCRDFYTLEEMNNALVKGINDYVGENDILIQLGDFSFGGAKYIKEFRDKINCKTIHAIEGNHCHLLQGNPQLREVFTSYNQLLYASCEGYQFLCSHYPFHSSYHQSHKGAINLYSHVHGSLDVPWKGLDCGIDNAYKLFGEYRPFNGQEIVEMMNKKEIVYESHHNSLTN